MSHRRTRLGPDVAYHHVLEAGFPVSACPRLTRLRRIRVRFTQARSDLVVFKGVIKCLQRSLYIFSTVR